MVNDRITREVRTIQKAFPTRALALICSVICLLVLLSATLGGAQEVATSGQESSANAAGNMATVPTGTRIMVKMVDAVDSNETRRMTVFVVHWRRI